MTTESPTLTALRGTASTLEASIAARQRELDPSNDFQLVTHREETRLADVRAEIARLEQLAAESTSSSTPPANPALAH